MACSAWPVFRPRVGTSGAFGRVKIMRTFKSSLQVNRLAAILSLATFSGAVAACKTHSEARGEIARNWTPPAQDAVRDVPVADVKAAIAKRLAAAPPEPVTTDQWKHTKKLYAAFGQAPLWL